VVISLTIDVPLLNRSIIWLLFP